MQVREAEIVRRTTETDISLKFTLDGSGKSEIASGCGFLDHMLTLFARHGRFDMVLTCSGDTQVDYHHTTEDIAICLGRAVAAALGERGGITRYASLILPMDEALILAAVDISGRGGYFGALDIPSEKVGNFDCELCDEFFTALAQNAGITLHVRQIAGRNSHHIIEGAFKAVARALAAAAAINPALDGEIPSTKGIL